MSRIIHRHIPVRKCNDTKDVDPLSLKPALARYANNVFTQLWLSSKNKDKISIGQHNLATSGSGASHDDIFKNLKTSKYDGVHFYGNSGRNIYSKSVCMFDSKHS